MPADDSYRPLTWRERGHALLVYFGLAEPEGGLAGTTADAITTLWDHLGGECPHGIGCYHVCPGCAADGNGLNEIRPVIIAARQGRLL